MSKLQSEQYYEEPQGLHVSEALSEGSTKLQEAAMRGAKF